MPQAPWPASAVEARAVASLLLYAGNARTHSAEQVAQIAASILAFGFVAPVLVDKHGEVIAGHGRLKAAKSLGLETVPTIIRAGLTDAQKAAYRLADTILANQREAEVGLTHDGVAVLIPPRPGSHMRRRPRACCVYPEA